MIDLTGLDTLAIAKRGESQSNGTFKVPKEITTSIAAAAEDEDMSESSVVVEESGHGGTRKRAHRRYRETTSETSRAGILLVL
jgi:pre-mRNA-splicing factor ATP-dependent RNA helicase DHX38/PRP16